MKQGQETEVQVVEEQLSDEQIEQEVGIVAGRLAGRYFDERVSEKGETNNG